MPIHNNEIAEIFGRVADLLEIKGENRFRVRAYRNAARTVGSLSRSAADLIEQDGGLPKLPGIGKDLAGKIEQIVKTGQLDLLKDLEDELPGELTKLMDVAGLGPKKVAKLYKELDITTVDELKEAAQKHKVSKLEGFGKKTEDNILQELEEIKQGGPERVSLLVAQENVESLVKYLKKAKGAKKVTVAGSYRRRKETIGDLDILVTCEKRSDLMDHYVNYEDVSKVVSKGQTKSTVVLKSGLQVDVRVLPEVSYGAALLYFTGSKEHNVAIRKIGVKKGLKINEYGVFKDDERVAGKSEGECYKQIDLPYIEPELRENRGEVEAGQEGKLPELVTDDDIKGDLHMHTKWTDGRYTAKQMAKAGNDRGYEYIAISDHSQRVTVAGGLNPDELRKEMEEIDKLNEELKGIAILKASEVDILENGSLDLPDDVLKELDLAICSVHYKFNLSRDKQTERIVRAMDNKYFTILGHPTGRMINERAGYEVDMEAVMEKARERGCFIELNAHPSRLDLDDVHCKMAREMGVKVVISTDAHSTDNLDYMRFGIGQARRGWLEANDVVNTRKLRDLWKLLKGIRG